MSEFVPKALPESENPNVSRESPLRELLVLLGGVASVLVLSYFALGFVSDQIASRISPETERKWFKSLRSSGDRPVGVSAQSAVNRAVMLLGRVQASSPLPANSRAPLDLRLDVLCIPHLNAFAAPGGRIILTAELLETLETENGLAFVIAHELGHFHKRHHLRSLGRGIALAGMGALLGLASSETLGSIAHGVGGLTSLRFSRAQEEEADEFAVETISRLYGHLSGADELFRKLREREKWEASIPDFVKTHPGLDERIAKLATRQSVGRGIASTEPIRLSGKIQVSQACPKRDGR